MVLFGIDPGTAVTGWGTIEADGNRLKLLGCGVIVTAPQALLPVRLQKIYDAIMECFERFRPDRVAIEEAFYAKNVHTTLILGHARGVAMLAAQKCGTRIAEYAPREIKKATTGNGNATKDQVEYMVKKLLSPPPESQLSDAYDALAVALCDFYHQGVRRLEEAVSAAPKLSACRNAGI